MNKLSFGIAVLSAATFSFAAKAPKSAEKYYSDAAFQYIENRLPTAEITCKEGLQHYPDDAKLQMLADRIEESKNEQQKQNQENNSSQDKQNPDRNSSENSQNENQNPNQDSDGQSSAGDSSAESSSSQGSENSGADNSSGESSSDSRGSSASEQNAPKESSDSSGEGENEEVPPGQMSPQEASQLLKDFDEEHGERKPWKPARGMARPEKDW